MASPLTGQDAWPAAGKAVEYLSLQGRSVLRPHVEGEDWFWTLNPYDGCELGCTFCSVRLDRKELSAWQQFENRIGVKVHTLEALRRELHGRDFAGRKVVLGSHTEPWQPAEEKFRITRTLLEVIAEVEEVDLRVNTRSSLVGRDMDVLKQIHDKGNVTVAFSLSSLDERITRLMEPRAPSTMRRLSAMEALARAGVPVGVMISPVLPGLDEEELGLDAMLSRATHAGARFAGLQFLEFGPAQRETFLSHVTDTYPDLAMRFRRVIGPKPQTREQREEIQLTFQQACARHGLMPLSQAAPRRPRVIRPPSQLQLFPI